MTDSPTVSERTGNPDILVILDSFHLGGTETFATRAVELLSEHGLNVHVLGLRPEGPLLERMRAAATEVHELGAATGKLRSVKLVLGIRRLVRRLRPRVVYTQDVFSNYLAAAALVGNRKPRFVSSWRWTTINTTNRRRLAGWAARRSHAVVTNTEALSADIAGHNVPLSKIAIVPNYLEPAMFDAGTAEHRREWRADLGIAPDACVVMCAGRLNPLKGPDIALEAFAQLPLQLRQTATLVFCGDGVMRAELERAVASQELGGSVHFTGAFRSPPNIFRHADLFLLPSRSEGMPNAMLEAAALGLPGVVTPVGGVPEVVRATFGAYLMAASPTAADLVPPLTQAIQDRHWRLSAGDSARAYAREHHSLESVRDVLVQALFTP